MVAYGGAIIKQNGFVDLFTNVLNLIPIKCFSLQIFY